MEMTKASTTIKTRLYMGAVAAKASKSELSYAEMARLKEAALKMLSELDQAIARMPAKERSAYLRGIV